MTSPDSSGLVISRSQMIQWVKQALEITQTWPSWGYLGGLSKDTIWELFSPSRAPKAFVQLPQRFHGRSMAPGHYHRSISRREPLY